MKAGRLFENALRKAQLTLKPGTEIKVRVQGKGESLHLIVRSSFAGDFEASILERSKRVSVESLKPYNPKMPVGERIRALRRSAGKTLDSVASKAGITKGSLCSIEKGERSVGLAVLRKIAKALGVPLIVLVE